MDRTAIRSAAPMLLPRRARESSKRDYGRLLIVGGSTGYSGAPTLASRAAVRSGAGLVNLFVPESIYTVAAVKNDEGHGRARPGRRGRTHDHARHRRHRGAAAPCGGALHGPGPRPQRGARPARARPAAGGGLPRRAGRRRALVLLPLRAQAAPPREGAR